MLRGKRVSCWIYCKPSRPLCREMRHASGEVCECGGGVGGKPHPHKRGGKLCVHSEGYAERMWEEMMKPVRKAG